jgi:hypothetical protein
MRREDLFDPCEAQREQDRVIAAALKKPQMPPSFDPIQAAVDRHPGLTEEKAEEIARAFGF